MSIAQVVYMLLGILIGATTITVICCCKLSSEVKKRMKEWSDE